MPDAAEMILNYLRGQQRAAAMSAKRASRDGNQERLKKYQTLYREAETRVRVAELIVREANQENTDGKIE